MVSARRRVTCIAGPLPPRLATVAATLVVLLASLTASFSYAGVAQVIVIVAAAGVLAAVLASACRHVVQPVRVRPSHPAAAGAVAASTAYWCAIDAPSCPHRPRAPGRH